MTNHFQRDLEHLHARILAFGSRIQEAVVTATRSLVERRASLAEQVIDHDDAFDREELEIDDECLKILALHQPVAGDLRFLTGAMKINNDLERIGDLAVNVAERAIDLAEKPPLDEPLDFAPMCETAGRMLRDALEALVRRDSALARTVGRNDDRVDEINRVHFERLLARMQRDPATVAQALDYLTASLNIERIADLATNIAEDVVFMVEAVVIRHGTSTLATHVAD